ncbi:DUF4254 domain-containing protein [candidate division KSB1 bacterium]|nr:DUF4254 domain-containing protein [candidate division KSB1 bacterium]
MDVNTWNLQNVKTNNYFQFFEALNIRWHQEFDGKVKPTDRFDNIFSNLHFFNYSLWHEEDEARRDDVDDSVIAQTKRNIDKFNQRRNDSIELLDTYILSLLKQHPGYSESQPLNSETPGSIIDRISIISLKIYHMDEQTKRTDVNADHIEACRKKANRLIEQKNDLRKCFNALIDEYMNGSKTLKVYFQFKMYNDPTLNPAVYAKQVAQ